MERLTSQNSCPTAATHTWHAVGEGQDVMFESYWHTTGTQRSAQWPRRTSHSMPTSVMKFRFGRKCSNSDAAEQLP